jgi:hypothetical protein
LKVNGGEVKENGFGEHKEAATKNDLGAVKVKENGVGEATEVAVHEEKGDLDTEKPKRNAVGDSEVAVHEVKGVELGAT